MGVGGGAVEDLVTADVPAAGAVCPICGRFEWTEPEHEISLREVNPRIIRGGGLQVHAFVCTGCGFVRLHRSDRL